MTERAIGISGAGRSEFVHRSRPAYPRYLVLIHHDSRGTRVLLRHPLPHPGAGLTVVRTADVSAGELPGVGRPA